MTDIINILKEQRALPASLLPLSRLAYSLQISHKEAAQIYQLYVNTIFAKEER